MDTGTRVVACTRAGLNRASGAFDGRVFKWWSALTGRTSQVESRADTIEPSVDKEMDARSGKLEARVKAVCPRLHALDQLQQQFRFRLADGSSLKLIVPEAGRDKAAGQLAAR